MAKKQLLVIEAHSDNSSIGIGGFLEKYRSDYQYHFCVMAVSGIHLYHKGKVSREERLLEYDQYVKHMNGIWQLVDGIPFDHDSALDTLPIKQLILAVEKVIQNVQPDVLIFQGPSFHQDHSLVYEAVIAATRPTCRFCPKEMYIMENPTYVHTLGFAKDFKANMYCELTPSQLEKKLACFEQCFPSQIRQGKNSLSLDGIRSWARYRGIEAGCEYAEALQVYMRCI